MTTEIINILSGVGAGAIICVLIFYFWLKKIIKADIVEPLIEPLKIEINGIKEDLKDRDKQFEKMNENIEAMTKSMLRIETFIDFWKERIESQK